MVTSGDDRTTTAWLPYSTRRRIIMDGKRHVTAADAAADPFDCERRRLRTAPDLVDRWKTGVRPSSDIDDEVTAFRPPPPLVAPLGITSVSISRYPL